VSYERQDRLKALVLAVCAFLLYTATRTRHFGGDDTVFAIAVQRWLDVGALEPTFIHPHHLLYNPMVAGLSWLVRCGQRGGGRGGRGGDLPGPSPARGGR